MKRILFIACCVLLAFTGTVAGAEKPVADMETVVVTATRQEETVYTVPANVSVITEDRIKESTATTVPDLLRTQAGILVNDISGNRRNFRVDLRGFGETAQSNTLVLVDGRRINQADLSGTDWTLIPLNRIQRIEVIRGGRGGVLYGDNASGGVINIITKKGDQAAVDAEAKAGSYQTFGASASAGGTHNDFSYAVSGSYLDSDGYRDNSGTNAKDAGANLDYLFGDTAAIGLSMGYHKDDTDLPGALKTSDFAAGASRTDSITPDNYTNTEDYYVALAPEAYFLTDSVVRFDMSYRNRTAFSFSDFSGGYFEGDTEIDHLAFSPQVILREPVAGYDNRLVAGLDYTDATEDITNFSVFFGTPSKGIFTLEKRNIGAYLHDELFLTDRLSLSGGYRYDRVKFEFAPSTPESTTMDENLYTAGANYRYADKSHVFARFSRSFRYPLMDELFSFFTNTINTEMVPQTSDDLEVGIRHDFSHGLSGTLTVFRMDTNDEIFYNPSTFRNENLQGEARRDGVEVSLTKVFSRVRLGGTYTFMNTEILDGQFEGNDVPNVPQHKASIDAQVDLGWGVGLGLNGIYVGERYFESDFGNRFDQQDDYTVFNARLTYVWKKCSAYVTVNNIFNEKYSEYGVLGGFPVEQAYYPSPETNFLAGVTFSY